MQRLVLNYLNPKPRRFQKGEWESLWNQTLKHNNRELAHRAKKLDGNAPAPASIRARARYAEYCARKGALSKANQAMTSDLTPSAAPTNINELRAKNPEPTHPNRDPVTQPASLIWPQKADTDAWWEEEDGQEYIQKHFNLQKIAKYFRTRSPVSAADVDGWRARELMAPLFMGDDEELHALIRDHLILPYLFGDFHPSHIQEYAGGLLFALEKPAKDGGGIRPIICGESWRRCFASLAANAVRGPISHIFTSTYENFLQTAGLQDGASHCAKILSSMYAALNTDPSDPDVIIKLDISNAFNVLCRQLTLDVLGGKASCDYACGLKEGDNIETVCEELRNMFQYFRAMRTTKSHLRYFDYLGNVLDAWGKTGGQQGDPLEMIVFCLSVHHLWGRTLNKHHQDACAVAYADDSYIKAKLSVALEVLSDIKHVLKEDAGLALNFDKTKILVKGISAADAHAAAQRMLAADPSLAHLSASLSPASFVVDGYIGLGVPIGTDAFIQHFVKDKCETIMEDVDKLDNIQDGFIHYQLIRFCQATRLQYLNCQIDLANQNCLQQQHVDFKISNTLLKKGTREAYKTWTQQDRAWVDMLLHESHDEGCFGHSVSHNTITRHDASYTTNTRFVAFLGTFASHAQQVWLTSNNLQDN